MYKLLSKNGQTFGFLLGAVVTGLFLLIMAGGWSKFSALGDSAEKYDTTIFNFGIYASIGLIIVGFVLWAFFSIFQMASNPKAAVRGLLGGVALIALFVISYLTASSEVTGPLAKSVENMGVGPTGLKLISGGITTSLILTLLAGVAILLSELRNFFK
ncbi:MAG: hypothetical protein IAE84_13305 [Saprospiraceae bacterium]|nr:hypothetical protein [Saprospiraceae bacterium]HRD81321.1 hypothetical protein [Saprospiraceae bacterium]HRF40099.1 hypothetical protein [Saprospiraceae bacterium]HRK83619.1 hypothetical protein [Saprospiraceae bacterium]